MQLFKGQAIIAIIFCNKGHYQSSMVGPTQQKLKFLVVKIWCYQLKEFVLTKPKLFEFFKYLNF